MKLRLEELRNKLGLSRRDVHEATGITLNTIGYYEKGGIPSIGNIEKIASAYNVNPAWLTGWINDTNQSQPLKIVVEKIVYVEKEGCRLPPYWNNDNNGRIIKWKESKRALQRRKV
ncbi:prophage LambdaSa2, Cro/CI family transcriptional regulator [Streptococcus varani]|uniref:Prophage LambdaSa2, Cro/CI family transcriptional regulator n=1 Tax=Streptococcus varani TaxID=1608583 RepID=A0A0E3WEZ6_9STRE|nr:helix-turn-helix transcriptional regulator [Streptococcus varani]CQR24593.1 prophage LambdaSa2, Cro/CI family transcriptional regulator [Streptococcus varani]